MKKLYLIVVALICSLACIIGIDCAVKHSLDKNIDKATYDNNIYTRNCSDYVMDKVITQNSMVVLGSSELSSADNIAYPESLFNEGYADYNMILMGAGHLQSIAQAVNVGALQNNIKNNKVVLIVSPQWFTPEGLTSEEYSSRFEEANYVEFLKNSNISKETKTAVANRMNELLTADPTTLQRVNKYEDIYLNHTLNPITYLEMSTYSTFRNAKTRFETANELKNRTISPDKSKYVKAEDIKFDELMDDAEKQGNIESTNNSYGIYDDYFNRYIKDSYEDLSGSYADSSFATSPEYDDLRLFLQVCKELGIDPLIVSVPVNGRWYDYAGFSKADRNTYYQNIRNICAEYGVALADFSDKEYELYFLKDIMHLGWKGWVYLDRAVYDFYKGEQVTDNTQYEDVDLQESQISNNVEALSDTAYILKRIDDKDLFKEIQVSIDDNIVLDSATQNGIRSGVYLHSLETGEYKIIFSAVSNTQQEKIEKKVYLEKKSVYKLSYVVDSIESKEVELKDINISKVIY